jgi:DNA invertase Pin-like site-specific DNA recombinase
VDVAVVYCRKSAESALPTDVSFDIQEAECEKYAAEKGYRVGRMFKESHTGADLVGRPLIWEAIDEVKSGRAQVLLVRNYDRLARSQDHQGVIVFEVEEKAGERVEAALEPYDPSDMAQRMMRSMMGIVAEAERLNAVARMERGKRYRAERGELPGASNPLLGYAWADDIEGERTYTGEGTAYRYQRVRSKNGKHSLTVRPADDGKRLAFKVATLVDVATFNAANAAVGAKDTNGRPPVDREATWLRLHVYCGACGARMVVKRCTDEWSAGQYKYECRNRKGSAVGKPCEGGDFNIRAHLLDPHAYAALTKIVALPDPYPLRERMLQRLGLDKVRALASMSECYQAQLTAKRTELDTARRRARQTTDDALAAQFMTDAEELNKSISAIEAEYNEARQALENFSSGIARVDATLERIKAGIKDIDNPTEADIRALPYEERRLLLASKGLYIRVWPQGWRKDHNITLSDRAERGNGQRVQVDYRWVVEPDKAASVDKWRHEHVEAWKQGERL